jgi:NAD(P)-dependent dehydrogenase (short-subunit alcohol dehydrogenase family)
MAASERIALVTGANRGLGREIARQLGMRGYRVIIAARHRARGQQALRELRALGVSADYVRLDVTDAASVRAAARAVGRRFGKLDALINNAGIAIDAAARGPLDASLARRTFETNVFGAYRVTQAMLPLLGRSGAGRIVNVSSRLGSLSLGIDPGWDFARGHVSAYALSKAALNALTVQLAVHLKTARIKVNAVCPGYVATDMNRGRGPRTVEQGARIAVRMATLPASGPTGGFFNDDGPVPW